MYTVKEVAQIIGGEVRGESEGIIRDIKPLQEAGVGDLTFFAPKKKKQAAELLTAAKLSKASAILVAEHNPEISCPQIVVKNPLQSVVALCFRIRPPATPEKSIHPTAVIDATATIGERCSIGAYCVVGAQVKLGDEVTLHPHVVVYDGAVIGNRATIHSGAVIRENCVVGADCLIQNGVVLGGDGFGYLPDKQIGHRRIPHIGRAILEDGVDLGANTTIDRGMLGDTRVGKNTKIDNLVMLGHNVRIGERSILCSQVGLSGSTTVGNDVILAGQVGAGDHITIGDRVKAGGQCGITQDVPADMEIWGTPYRRVTDEMRVSTLLDKLGELFRRVGKLEKMLADETKDE